MNFLTVLIRQICILICWDLTNAQIGNVSYVIVCRLSAVSLLSVDFGGFTLGGLASFLTFNKSLNMPIMQVSQQLNFIVMAMAGAERVFGLLDEKPEDRRRLCYSGQCQGRKRTDR